MMRILLVNYEYTTTGSTLALLRLAEHLRSAAHDISVSAAIAANGPIKTAYLERGFPVLELPPSSGIDVAICNTVVTAPQVLELSGWTRTVWWIHESSVGLAHLLANPQQITAFQRASAVVFPIAHLRDAVYRSFLYDQDAARFHVIPHGIANPGSPATGGAKDSTFRVVSVGAIYPRKRHEDLIRAMALYQNPAAKCIIAGRFYVLPEDCQRLVADNPDRFELTGELDHPAVIELLAGADVFCLPSASEVLPLTTLEAGILGKPMVLSDLLVYEGIWRHGRNCLLHPVGAIGLLAQSIAMLAGNAELRGRLGAAAHRTASPYTEAACFARFDALLATLAA
jgi:glycosyltransferase involved in cell wall biosynthesis